jgi:hypothetical protein
MSFLRWTYKEMDSESQVRLYVNTKLGRWAAWAFPQEARTGMSAREIAVQETPDKARERFASWNSEPSEDWVYFCTVHHHCSASAFQSGTDEQNEKGQDGLHITVGRMAAERHELHARFYVGGNCFDPDMSLFWPIEQELVEQVPPSLLDELARFQMSERVVVDFPEAWRKNVIEVRRERKSETVRDHGFWQLQTPAMPSWLRGEQTVHEIMRQCEMSGITEQDFVETLQSLSGDAIVRIIIETCLENELTPEELLLQMKDCVLPY